MTSRVHVGRVRDAAGALAGEFAEALGVVAGEVEFRGAASLPSAYPVSGLAVG